MSTIVRAAGAIIVLIGLSGCYAATRSTVHMIDAQQRLLEAREQGAASQAVYAWTMADEYMKKARDEWGRSEFKSAERLFAKSKKWSEEAARLAKVAGPAEAIESLPDETMPQAPQAPQAPRAPAEDSNDDAFEDDDDEGLW
jgi:hypothetical protein